MDKCEHGCTLISTKNFEFHYIFTKSLFVEALSGSALTLHDTSNCAVDEATCLADEISFSSLDIPWTRAFADSTKL